MYESAFSRAVTKKGKSLPTFDEMKSNIALILYNSHVSMGSNVRSPLNYIPIGGYHIDTEVKPLPEVSELLFTIYKIYGFIFCLFSFLLGFTENNG